MNALKMLVTGAVGKLGSATAAALTAAGLDVRATDRVQRDGLAVPVRAADLLDFAAVQQLVAGMDAVVHIANHPNAYAAEPHRVFNENVAMNMNVFLAAAGAGVPKVVYASSVQAQVGTRLFGTGRDQPSGLAYLPLDGQTPKRPGSHYGLSKCVGEEQLDYCVKILGLPSATAVRFPMLLRRQRFAEWRATEAKLERVNPTTPLDEAFTWLSMEDAARLVLAILRADLPGCRCYFPAHPKPRLEGSIREIIGMFYAGVPLKRPLEQLDSLVDCSDIERETGWRAEDDLWA